MIGSTILGRIDLSETKGLESVTHVGRSTIDLDTLFASLGRIPEAFVLKLALFFRPKGRQDVARGVSPRRYTRLRHASADLTMQSRGLVPRIVRFPATARSPARECRSDDAIPGGFPGAFSFSRQHGRTFPLRRARLKVRAGVRPLDSEKRNDPPGKPLILCSLGCPWVARSHHSPGKPAGFVDNRAGSHTGLHADAVTRLKWATSKSICAGLRRTGIPDQASALTGRADQSPQA